MEAMLQQHKDTLAEFQKLKFQALLRELNVESDIDDATLPEVEKAAQRLIQWSANRGHDRVEENLQELQGLMLEYADWLHVEEHESACLLLAKFRYLLMLLGAKQVSPRDVSLFEVERKIQDIAVNASARYATRLNMIARDLEGWRALCNDALPAAVENLLFGQSCHMHRHRLLGKEPTLRDAIQNQASKVTQQVPYKLMRNWSNAVLHLIVQNLIPSTKRNER
jgi:hypothetical protein